MAKTYYIIDFDSTFTQVEALDELSKISLKSNPQKDNIHKQIEELTNAAMDGKLSFTESLEKRVQLLCANREHLKSLVSFLKKQISHSFARNKDFFKKHNEQVLIVSGGFKEFITPVVTPFGIKPENIYANTFVFDNKGNIVGYDKANPLSQEGGKVKLLKSMNFDGDIYGIGDGYSDFQLKESGMIKKFFAFTENIARASVTTKADHVTPSFDEFLYINNLPRAISYPKNRILCLIIGKVSNEVTEFLKTDGFSIRQKETFEEKYTKDVGIILLANGERISDEQLSRAEKLKTLGYLGNIDSQVNLNICTKMGVVVFEKSSNDLSVAQKVADFMNKGYTQGSCNMPNIKLSKLPNAHRLIHIHHNVPGVLAQVNNVYAKHNVNILAQFLLTNKDVGLVVTDVEKGYDKDVIKGLKKIDYTIKFRLLY